MTDFIAHTAEALRIRPDLIVNRYFARGHRDGSNWRCGDVYGTPGQSFAFTLSGRWQGRGYDFASGERFDGLDIVRLREGLPDMMTTARWVHEHLLGLAARDLPGGDGARKTAAGDRHDLVVRQRKAAYVYALGGRFARSPGETYLRDERRVFLPDHFGLRWHGHVLRRSADGRSVGQSALLVPVRGEMGELRAVGKYFLRPDGHLDRGLARPKSVSGDNRGHAVMLNGRCRDVWLVSEGFEDGATLKMYRPDQTVRCVLGAGNIPNLKVPVRGVRVLVLFEDRDRAGEQARARLFARLAEESQSQNRAPVKCVALRVPEGFKDVNGFHRAVGSDVMAGWLAEELDGLVGA